MRLERLSLPKVFGEDCKVAGFGIVTTGVLDPAPARFPNHDAKALGRGLLASGLVGFEGQKNLFKVGSQGDADPKVAKVEDPG